SMVHPKHRRQTRIVGELSRRQSHNELRRKGHSDHAELAQRSVDHNGQGRARAEIVSRRETIDQNDLIWMARVELATLLEKESVQLGGGVAIDTHDRPGDRPRELVER